LRGLIFPKAHKNPQLPTFSHVAHYKSGQCKVKQAITEKRRKSQEKSGNVVKQEGKKCNLNLTKNNLNNKNKAIECKLNVKP
jgi:hypothetical protein